MSSLHCTACGTEAEAKCDCHKPYAYMPAHEAAALAVAAHPEKTDRAISEITGIPHKTVSRARDATVSNDTIAFRIGRNGKKYPVRKPAPELEARRQRAVAEQKEGKKRKDIAKDIAAETGITTRIVYQDLKREDARDEGFEAGRLYERENPVVSRDDLTKTQQKRLDACLRAYERKLAAQFEETVHKEILRRVEEYVAPRFRERERDAEQSRKAYRHKGLFKREEYNVILRCVHPDRSASIEEKNEAFRLLHENRLLLLSEKDDPRTYPPIPTADEFMAGIKRPFRKPE